MQSSGLSWPAGSSWGGLILLSTGYLGEVRSIIRHEMVVVVLLRLSIWLSFAILADLILTGSPNDQRTKYSQDQVAIE